MDPDQTAPIGAVCSGSTLFASILNTSVMLDNHLKQTTFSDVFFFLGALRVKSHDFYINRKGEKRFIFSSHNRLLGSDLYFVHAVAPDSIPYADGHLRSCLTAVIGTFFAYTSCQSMGNAASYGQLTANDRE